jgi:hypothetical protein
MLIGRILNRGSGRKVRNLSSEKSFLPQPFSEQVKCKSVRIKQQIPKVMLSLENNFPYTNQWVRLVNSGNENKSKYSFTSLE